MDFLQQINRDSSKIRPLLVLVVGTWILLALMLIFLDLPLSIFLVDYNSSWGEFVALYGEIPGHIVISISVFLLLSDRVKRTNWDYNLLFWFGLIINSILILGIILSIFSGYKVELNEGILITGILMICQVIIINHLKNKKIPDSRRYIDFAKISLVLAVINPLLFVQSIKLLWGRTRFRDLSGDYHEFTAWFVPQGLTGHKSFPSGHTAMGWMCLPLLFLLPKTGRMRRALQGLIFLWGIYVAVGRVIIGAHYVSDVIFSSEMAFLVYLALITYWKEDNSQNEVQAIE